MDRIKIKEKAREVIKGNLWEIWKPALIIFLINLVLSTIVLYVFKIDENSRYLDLADIAISIILLPLSIGQITYILKLIRKKQYGVKDIFSQTNNIVCIIVVNIVISLCITFGFALLIVPGIILALMFSMTTYILAEGERNIGAVLNKSANIIEGYKKNYLLFQLSFLGWILLGVVTLGIAYIWVYPYITVANALYYEELIKKNRIKSKEIK